MITILLDLRCKSLNFIFSLQIIRTKALLKEIYEEEKKIHEENEIVVNNQQRRKSPGNSLLRNIFANRYRREERDEFEEYIVIEDIGFDAYPFKWWASQESRFPTLSCLAKKYLAIPATSTSSERLFSDAGNIMTVKCANLLPSTFEHLVFCKRNWRLIGKIFSD